MRLLSLLALALTACDTAPPSSPDVDALAARLDALDQETTAGFQAQAERIATLEARVEALEDENAAAETRIAALEDELAAVSADLDTVEAAVESVLAGGDLSGLVDAIADHEARLVALEGAGLATADWIASQGYTTESWVTSQGYATQSTVDALAARVGAAETDVAALQSSATSFAADLSALQADTTALDADLAALDAEVTDLATYTPGLDALWTYLSVDTGAATVTFSGANVHIDNGAGATATTNGLGNLVVGYNESDGAARTGSHAVVVGTNHGWTSYGAVLAGDGNRLDTPFTSALD